jgi:hypothetical protein
VNARHALTLQDLLAIEDDAALLDFRCPRTGLLLWPLVRVAVLRSVMAELLYGDAGGAQVVSARRVSPRRAAGTLAKSVLHNARAGRYGPSEVCLMPTGIGLQPWRGKWFNRLSDHFALALPECSIVIEDQFDWQWPFPRHFERVMLHAPLQARMALAGRVATRAEHHALAGRLIGHVAARAEREIGWRMPAERRAALAAMLARKAAALPSGYEAYRRLLAGTGARLLVKEDACYGPASVIIAAARSLGMATAEYQHGAISAGHDGYNFAPTLRASEEYRRTLPDTFLAYGQWWADQVNAPVRKIAIGNPHRSAQLAGQAPATGERRDVLVLGDGVETAVYLALVRAIAPAALRAGLRVVFRPHPLERATLARHWQAVPGVVLDENTDIYGSLAGAHAVVSELSTGLFEAIGLADKVFLWNTPKARFAYPVHPFATFDDAGQLAAMLEGGSEGALSAAQVEAIWAPGWREGYARYVEGALASAGQGKAA